MHGIRCKSLLRWMLLTFWTGENQHPPVVWVEAFPLQHHPFCGRGRIDVDQTPARGCCCPCVIVSSGDGHARSKLSGACEFDKVGVVEFEICGIGQGSEGCYGYGSR